MCPKWPLFLFIFFFNSFSRQFIFKKSTDFLSQKSKFYSNVNRLCCLETAASLNHLHDNKSISLLFQNFEICKTQTLFPDLTVLYVIVNFISRIYCLLCRANYVFVECLYCLLFCFYQYCR